MRTEIRKAFQHYRAWQSLHLQDRMTQAFDVMRVWVPGMVRRALYGLSLQPADLDEIVAYVESEWWFYMRDKAPKFLGRRRFYRFFKSWVRYTAFHALRSVFRGRGVPEDYEYRPSRMPHPRDAESKIFLEELPAKVLKEIKNRCRFNGSLTPAITYAVQMFLEGESPVPRFLRVHFGVRDPQFVIDYALVRCRIALYRIRRQHEAALSDAPVDFVFAYGSEPLDL